MQHPKKARLSWITRARNAEREDWATGFFLRAVGRQGIHLAGYTAQTLEQEQDEREAGQVLIPILEISYGTLERSVLVTAEIEHEDKQEHEHEQTTRFATGSS
jgi:hypothetical protein